jgi:hypothetical protein
VEVSISEAKAGAQVKNVGAIAPSFVPVRVQRDHVRLYLVALSRLALEVSRNPRLLPSFIRIVSRVPSTIEALRCERRRAA